MRKVWRGVAGGTFFSVKPAVRGWCGCVLVYGSRLFIGCSGGETIVTAFVFQYVFVKSVDIWGARRFFSLPILNAKAESKQIEGRLSCIVCNRRGEEDGGGHTEDIVSRQF